MKLLSLLRGGQTALLACGAVLFAAFQPSAEAASSPSFAPYSFQSLTGNQFDHVAVLTLNANCGGTDVLSGNATINGDFAVAGSGNISLTKNSVITGSLTYERKGMLSKAGTATIGGGIYSGAIDDAVLDLGAFYAQTASTIGALLPTSFGFPTSIDSNKSLSLTSKGLAVLKLSDFELSNNATLTLHGNSSSYFVFNVSKNFSLSDANVKLTGGLTADHVIFNIRGSSGVTSLSGNSELDGILLAVNRNVSLSGNAKVVGTIVANTVALSGNSSVQCPVVSP